MRIDSYTCEYVDGTVNCEHVPDGKMLGSVMFGCPCGCGHEVYICVTDCGGDRRHWDLTVDDEMRPTLSPSLQLTGGCQSHFFIRNGKVEWA